MNDALEKLERGWDSIKKAPFHFAASVLALVVLGWGVISWHYTAVIQGKDSTIQSKDAVIEAKEATIVAKEKSVEAVRQTLSAKDELIISLTNQYTRFLQFQAELAAAHTNLLEQEKKLGTVEYWVQNLVDATTNEVFSIASTNRFVAVAESDGATTVFLVLSRAPVMGSVRATVVDETSRYPLELDTHPSKTPFVNLLNYGLWSFDTNTIKIRISYVIDSRETNLLTKLVSSQIRRMPPESGWRFEIVR